MVIKRISIQESKIKASLLLKWLRSDEQEKAEKALKRLAGIALFQGISFKEMRQKIASVKLKHALEAVALEAGYSSWKELIDNEDISWYRQSSPFVMLWFSNYEEAKECLGIKDEGYLLCYKSDYFIASAAYIDFIGLDPKDKNWRAIGYDTAKPEDNQAMRGLKKSLQEATKAMNR
jgi:hypothetical protein